MKVLEPAAAARDAVAAHPDRPATAVVHDAPDLRLVVFRIAPRQAVAVHTSRSTVMLQVVAGAGMVSGADGEREVRVGDVVVYDASEPHSMRATDQEMVLLAAITPRPGSR
jgi:quercetin dioxygenase-like cupin family protein